MSLLDSQEAIGAVTELLRTRVSMRLNNLAVVVGRPEAATNSTGRKLNLFLYRIGFDGYLRNIPLDSGQEPPLWLVLHYLVTAFDENKESDSAEAHRLLGRGLAALQELNFLRPNVAQLVKNPEPLKITFDEADVELLSKLMQGTDEKYRISAAFQVRPVMVMTDQPASYAPLVKTVGPPLPNPPPYDQAGVQVLPNLGPRLASVLPVRFTRAGNLDLDGARPRRRRSGAGRRGVAGRNDIARRRRDGHGSGDCRPVGRVLPGDRHQAARQRTHDQQ